MRILVALAALGGCATPVFDPPGTVIDAAPRDAPAACVNVDLELGGCQRDDGTACTGALGETRRFAELADGGAVPVVNGPQGAAMLVFSARTSGIVAGDPADPLAADNPLVELVVARDGIELALYRGKIGFADDGAGRVVAAGLFVITEGSELAGVPLRAHGLLVDRAGARRCGEIGFVGGAASARISTR
jgi:hypothetical protein